MNDENEITHQIILSQTEKINYREDSRAWKFVDPNINDPKSIQTHSSESVFMLVNEKGKWVSDVLCRNSQLNCSIKRIIIRPFSTT